MAAPVSIHRTALPAALDTLDRIRSQLERELAWAVFEWNAEPLWQHVRFEVEDTLIGHWRDGELKGDTPAEAFSVRCGRDTMTGADLDEDLLVVLVGLAVAAPAEFETIRIEQTVGRRRGHRPAKERS